MWRIFYNYIFIKRFYFGDKIFLNLKLHHLQNVLFWWQVVFQSCGGFSTATPSSRGSILVTRSFSIMWRIFYNYVFFKRFYFGDKIFLNHVADFLQLYIPQNVLFWWQASYPPFWELIKLSTILGIWGELSTILGIWAKVIHQFRNLLLDWWNGGYNCENVDNTFHLFGRSLRELFIFWTVLDTW